MSGFRSQKGSVVNPGTDVRVIAAGDTIYYDKAAGHSMFISERAYTVILERDVVVVL